MKRHPCYIRIWSTTTKQSSDLINRFVNVWLALVTKRTKPQITHGSTLKTNPEMKDLPPRDRTTTMRTCNSVFSQVRAGVLARLSSLSIGGREARAGGRACGVAAALVVIRRRQRQVRGHGHHPPASCSAPPTQSLSHRCPRKHLLQAWRNLKEHVMVSSITLGHHVILTSFGVRTRTQGHEYELGKDILLSKPQSLDASF
jgi:hypothetical protein